MKSTMTTEEAGALLGMKPAEVTHVVDTDDGVEVTTFDGVTVIIVPDDRPDGAGQTGVLMRRHPLEGTRPADQLPPTGLPLFVPRSAEGPALEVDPDSELPATLEQTEGPALEGDTVAEHEADDSEAPALGSVILIDDEDELRKLSRPLLDLQATARGIDPSGYGNRAALASAIIEHDEDT